MSRATALKSGATYGDLCALPDHLVGEILGGELYATPRPSLPHARAASVLGVELGGPFHRGRRTGWMVVAGRAGAAP